MPLSLDNESVHVWAITVDAHLTRVQSLETLLVPAERTQATRFRSDLARARAVVGRAMLRVVLGGYLDADPASLRFTHGAYGKPALAAVCNRAGLSFNTSHSGDLILYAVARRAVGADVEQIRSDTNLLGLAQRWFSKAEYQALCDLPCELRLKAFYATWTRKEAYLKARGDGLARGLAHFQVSVDPQAPASLLADAREPHAPSKWYLADLSLGPGYAAALTTEGRAEVTLFREEINRASA
jgi:4'-phosphopantetheinyl transferase